MYLHLSSLVLLFVRSGGDSICSHMWRLAVILSQLNFCCEHRLDKHNNGFIRLRDWGACDSTLQPAIEKLTAQYMRKHMALPSPTLSSSEAMSEYGQRLRAQEVSTLRQVRELCSMCVLFRIRGGGVCYVLISTPWIPKRGILLI